MHNFLSISKASAQTGRVRAALMPVVGALVVAVSTFFASSAAFAASQIGAISESNGSVTVERAAGGSENGVVGLAVYQDDAVVTGANSSVGITFADETSFALGAGGRMVLDEYAYDPAANTGGGTLAVLTGSFAFTSGQIAKVAPDALKVTTPTLSIGVRGTTVAGKAAPAGQTSYAILIRDKSGSVGKIQVFNAASNGYLIEKARYGSTATDQNKPVTPPRYFGAEEVEDLVGDALNALPFEVMLMDMMKPSAVQDNIQDSIDDVIDEAIIESFESGEGHVQ